MVSRNGFLICYLKFKLQDDLAAEEDDTASQLSTNLYNPSNLIFPADEVNWEGEEVLDTKPEEINDVIGFDEGGEVYASPNREKRSLPTSSSRQRVINYKICRTMCFLCS